MSGNAFWIKGMGMAVSHTIPWKKIHSVSNNSHFWVYFSRELLYEIQFLTRIQASGTAGKRIFKATRALGFGAKLQTVPQSELPIEKETLVIFWRVTRKSFGLCNRSSQSLARGTEGGEIIFEPSLMVRLYYTLKVLAGNWKKGGKPGNTGILQYHLPVDRGHFSFFNAPNASIRTDGCRYEYRQLMLRR